MRGLRTRERSTVIKLTKATNNRLGSLRDRPSRCTDSGHSRKTLARPVRPEGAGNSGSIGRCQNRSDDGIRPCISRALISIVIQPTATIKSQQIALCSRKEPAGQ